MADYKFNVYLHTSGSKPMSEYSFTLPSFYFTTNEFVSPDVDVIITNSFLSCVGANTYNAQASLGGTSSEESVVIETVFNIAVVYVNSNTTGFVNTMSILYSTANDIVWMKNYAIPILYT